LDSYGTHLQPEITQLLKTNYKTNAVFSPSKLTPILQMVDVAKIALLKLDYKISVLNGTGQQHQNSEKKVMVKGLVIKRLLKWLSLHVIV
jgi:hypothetical protein